MSPSPTEFDYRLTALDRAVNLASTGRIEPDEVIDFAARFEAVLRGTADTPPPTSPDAGSGAARILAARAHQLAQGFTPEHDRREHTPRDLFFAARAYLENRAGLLPWAAPADWRSMPEAERLAKAGAFVAALIDFPLDISADELDSITTVRCPLCGHVPHDPDACYNMGSDNDCSCPGATLRDEVAALAGPLTDDLLNLVADRLYARPLRHDHPYNARQREADVAFIRGNAS